MRYYNRWQPPKPQPKPKTPAPAVSALMYDEFMAREWTQGEWLPTPEPQPTPAPAARLNIEPPPWANDSGTLAPAELPPTPAPHWKPPPPPWATDNGDEQQEDEQT